MNTTVTFVELVEIMAEASSTSKRVCELFLRELFSTISQALINGESVKVNGVGTFKVTQVKSRKNVKGKAGEVMQNKVTFTPDKTLAEAVNQPFAHFDTVILDDAMTDEKLAEIDEQHPSAVQPTDMDVLEQPFDVPELSEPAPTPEPDGFYDLASFDAIAPSVSAASEADAQPKQEEPAAPAASAAKIDTNETVKASTEKISTEKASTESVAQPKIDELKRKPMLIGRPIDGPSHPVPKPEEDEEAVVSKRFYRPEPRNAYKPSPEQIEKAAHKKDKRWMWVLPLALALVALVWWLSSRPSGKADAPVQQEVAVVDTDSVAAGAVETVEVAEVKKEAEEPESAKTAEPSKPAQDKAEVKTANPDKAKAKVVTDVITRTEVLTTLAEKYYGSQWFWVYIYEENKAIISNPNNVKPGTRVVIPPAEKYGIDVHNPASLKKAQRRSWELLK